MKKKFNAAIVGCGWAGDIHMADLKKLPDLYSVVACCDPNADRAATFAGAHGIPSVHGDFQEVLARADVDIVVLCTPPMLHYPMAIEALRKDKTVVCEKPLTSSLELADRMIEAQAASRGRVMPIFQYRFGDGAARVKHVIEAGLAGRHFVTSVEVARTRGADYYREKWRGRFASELGGVHVTQAIHIQDMLQWLLGPAGSVMSFRTTRVNDIEVEDCAVASIRLKDGSLLSTASTLGSVGQLTRIRMCFENVTFERNSDHDTSKPADDPWVVLPRNPEIAAAIAAKMAEIGNGHRWFARQYELCHQALVTGGDLPVTLHDARASLEMITALYFSDETGAAVALPIGRGHPRYAGWVPVAG